MKTVLITGALGFIGSHVVDRFAQDEEYLVIGLDNMLTGTKSFKNPDAIYHIEDITDKQALERIFVHYDIDIICHLAARPRVGLSVEDPIGTHQTNVIGTLNLLEMARKYGVEKFINTSSSSVYGLQDTHIMVETMERHPLSPYAIQKAQGEDYCRWYNDYFKIPMIILRPFNVWGFRQASEGGYCLVLGKFITQKKNGQPLTIYGDGTQTRAYTYVEDVAEAFYLSAKCDKDFAIFNVGTHEETSVNELAELVGGEVQHIIPNPRGDIEEARKCANWDAIAEIGWKPTVSIKQLRDKLEI